MVSFHRLWLRVIKPTSFLPKGEVVFCIIDDGNEFRVKSSNTYSGVNEFVFDNNHREHFKIYQ